MPSTAALDALATSLQTGELRPVANANVGSDEHADQSVQNEVMETDIALLMLQSDIRGRVLQAQERVRDGVYGLCMGCDKPIPKARLQAIPYAVNCVKCEEKAGG